MRGTWEYQGGISNGKKEGATEGYKLQRKYDKDHFEAVVIEPDTTPQHYQSGNYLLTADSCFETETYNTMSAQLTGKTIRYAYTLHHDTLTLKGKLPGGMQVEEYWTKVK